MILYKLELKKDLLLQYYIKWIRINTLLGRGNRTLGINKLKIIEFDFWIKKIVCELEIRILLLSHFNKIIMIKKSIFEIIQIWIVKRSL